MLAVTVVRARVRGLAMRLAIGLVLPLSLATGAARAQLGVPVLPPLPVSTLGRTVETTTQGLTQGAFGQVDAVAQSALRVTHLRALLAAHRDTLEADPRGAPMLRGRLVSIGPSEAGLDTARTAGFEIVDDRTIDGVDLRIVVLGVPARLSTASALRRLRTLDPTGSYDFDHLYSEGGTASGAVAAAANAPGDAADVSFPHARIGLVDSGVDRGHPAFISSSVQLWGCDGKPVPAAHGTAVGSLLVGRAGAFHGAAPGATLFAADVYCNEPTGGSVVAIASALGWLAQQQVPVINVSLVGPANRLLEQTLRLLQQRGVLVVAAVGNDGPAAPPLYPAAYPGVIGVTGVDAQRHVLLEAGRGKQVMFAAPGNDMAAAAPGSAWVDVRGTSFAAPIVAGLLARELGAPDRAAADAAIEQLGGGAVDLGARGVDRVYGRGLVGEGVRVTLAALGAAPAGASATLND